MKPSTPPPPKMSFSFAPIQRKPPTPQQDPHLAAILSLVNQARGMWRGIGLKLV